MKNQLIDIGVNLMHKQFDSDREQLIKIAKEDEITPLIITSTNIKESEKAAIYVANYPNQLYCTVGIHPHDAKTCGDFTIERLKKLAQFEQVVAIGECGLDYDRDFSPRNIQRIWFEKQIELAEELNMPLFLHERAAYKDFKEILSRHKDICSKSVVHCFTGMGLELQTYLSLGCFIGVTGWICDKRRGGSLRSLIKMIPLDRLMIETDAPFLIPPNIKSNNRRNEPIYLRHVVKEIATCLGKEETFISELTTKNAKLFFHI